MAVKPIPEGYHTVTPYLVVKDAAGLLSFVKQAFGAQELVRIAGPEESVVHAEVRIGDSRLMLGETTEQFPPMPATIYLYVEDCDAVYRQAVEAGATTREEPTTKFFGDRIANVRDPFGNAWNMATHVEDVPEDELARRAAAQAGQ